jgi:hypothetical protein
LVKSIEDAALAMASVFRSVELPLPTEMPLASETILRRFTDLIAKFMPFDLVIDEETADGSRRVSQRTVCAAVGARLPAPCTTLRPTRDTARVY